MKMLTKHYCYRALEAEKLLSSNISNILLPDVAPMKPHSNPIYMDIYTNQELPLKQAFSICHLDTSCAVSMGSRNTSHID